LLTPWRAGFPAIIDVLHIQVPVTTLDALQLNGVTGIKLDAKGAEQEVILGARDTLQRSRPAISIELEERHRSGCTVAVPSIMEGWGYECYFETEGNLLPLSGFHKDSIQKSSGSPADSNYSRPYVYCSSFIPKEDTDLRQRLSDGYFMKSAQRSECFASREMLPLFRNTSSEPR
jgi:hypothetical protein